MKHVRAVSALREKGQGGNQGGNQGGGMSRPHQLLLLLLPLLLPLLLLLPAIQGPLVSYNFVRAPPDCLFNLMGKRVRTN